MVQYTLGFPPEKLDGKLHLTVHRALRGSGLAVAGSAVCNSSAQ
jgi:hypothetical protein